MIRSNTWIDSPSIKIMCPALLARGHFFIANRLVCGAPWTAAPPLRLINIIFGCKRGFFSSQFSKILQILNENKRSEVEQLGFSCARTGGSGETCLTVQILQNGASLHSNYPMGSAHCRRPLSMTLRSVNVGMLSTSADAHRRLPMWTRQMEP